jgi:hypothetical protein
MSDGKPLANWMLVLVVRKLALNHEIDDPIFSPAAMAGREVDRAVCSRNEVK